MAKKSMAYEGTERRVNMGKLESDVAAIAKIVSRWEDRFGMMGESVEGLRQEFKEMNGTLRQVEITAAKSTGSCGSKHEAIDKSFEALWKRSDSLSRKVNILGGVYAFLGGLMGYLAGFFNKG
jgi:archaellum component FlaC